jgi:hypothetical protein
MDLFYLPWMSGRGAEPAARYGTTTRDEVWNCQIWQCKRHATPKSGLWLNTLLNVCALIMHSTQGFCSLCHLLSVDIYLKMLYINFYNILVELGDGTVRLHPILGDLGCIPAHIKCMKLLQSADIIYLLRNEFHICYLQYIVPQFRCDPLGDVPGSNTFVKGVKNAIRETCTWNNISTD